MLRIERSSRHDIDRLRAFDPYAQISDARFRQFTAWASAGQVQIGVVDGDVAGIAVLTDAFFQQPFIELLLVGEAYRRQGLGRALVEHCVAVSPGQKIWTSTNTSNAAMRALLAKAGFIESGRVDNLDEGDPELIFVRLPTGAPRQPS